MTVNAAHARGPRRDTLCPPTTAETPAITDSELPTSDTDRCPHTHPDCPALRCLLAHGHPGLCWRVDRAPYRAAYWSTGDAP